MRKDEKGQVVAELQEELGAASSLIISGYRGLTVKELTELHRGVGGLGAHMRVVKKRSCFAPLRAGMRLRSASTWMGRLR